MNNNNSEGKNWSLILKKRHQHTLTYLCPGVGKLQSTGQIQHTGCFYKYSSTEIQPRPLTKDLCMAGWSWLKWQSREAVTETMKPTKPKMFTSWLLTENVCLLSAHREAMHRSWIYHVIHYQNVSNIVIRHWVPACILPILPSVNFLKESIPTS